MKPLFIIFGLFYVGFISAQSNLFISTNEASYVDQVISGSSTQDVSPIPFNPSENITFDKKMTFSANTNSGISSTSQFLVNSNKGYMGMDKEMIERFAGITLPDDEDFKVEYRITATNGKTYYFVEIQGVKYVMNRLPINMVEADQTNMSVKKFNQNFSQTGTTLNVSSQNFQSKEYTATSPDTGRPVNVYVAEQNNVNLPPTNTPKTVGIFGLGYIYTDNKTQLVTRLENDNGTAELERVENTNVSINGNSYLKYETKVQNDNEYMSDVTEDVFRKKRENISESPSQQADISNKSLEILELEEEMESKRKRTINKYIEDGSPTEKTSEYIYESLDPKDMVTVQKLQCEKRILEIDKKLGRMSNNNPDYTRLVNEKQCLETKIVDYKKAETKMIEIKDLHAENPHEGNKEKMSYFFTEVSQNIMARRCDN